MNAYQLAAYEAPVGDGDLPGEGRHNHGEVYAGVAVSVVLTADVGRDGEALFGHRGMWHCSVAVWPDRAMGRGRHPIPPVEWTTAQRRAAERVAARNLAGIGAGRGLQGEDGPHALHCYLPMSDAERVGLGLT